MKSCEELAPLLTAHASGDVSAEERAEVEAHLESCEACRDERAELAELLALAEPEPMNDLEKHALAQLPGQVRAAWQAQERTKRSSWRFAAGGLVAAAAAMLFALRIGPGPVPQPHRVSPPVVAQANPNASNVSAPSSDSAELDVDALADGPVELADDSSDAYANDPELAPTVFSDEGDDL